ncbi:hypothetical protein HHI36_020642 [Cryptolaemus montrouzieri]|uniref:Uncharacterized protein n=1 Tax=Cryptolaemus montrouzieri TaxID=559131 RepID=A0ABD2NBM3_9CUCU
MQENRSDNQQLQGHGVEKDRVHVQSENFTKRSDKQLRSKWESLKKNARKDYAAETLTPLSEKVSKILDWGNDNETDMELGTSMKFKEEPYFNEVTYEENESEMDQWSPSDFQTNQNSSETVFQPKVQENIDINAEEKMVFHKLTAKEIQPNIDEIQLDQNVTHARPVTIASAFAAPSGKFNNEFLISGYPIPEKSPNKETTIHPILEPVITKVSRGVQCERRRVHRQSFCHHTTNNNGLIALQKRLLIEENRRKKQKHETEMEILKIELQIKKKQLNDLEKL